MLTSAHSLRLAASSLLGTMLVPLVVSTTFAAGSSSLLTPLPTSQSTVQDNLCLAALPDPLATLDSAILPARFEQVDASNNNTVVITEAKDGMIHSFGSETTVMTKATQQEIADANTTPTPTPEPITTIVPTAELLAAENQSTGSVLNADVLFNLVNATRAAYGLPAFQKDDRICELALERAPEADKEIWVTHNMHAGFYARNLPYWATENLISMQTEQQALDWWMHSPVHRAAILGNWKYACIACSGKSCSMIFTNFDPKVSAPSAQTATTPTPTPASASTTPPTNPVTQAVSTVSSLVK